MINTPEQLRILLVEDHDDVAEMMLLMLGMLGHNAERARGVKDALSIANGKSFDLLVVDYGLPDGSGDELIRQLPQSRAILLTAYSESFLEERLKGLAAQFRQKPLDLDSLKSAIEDVMKMKPT